ncbi:hypothetical protein C8R42DRAFT_304154 [Lentinula raphanica]|nr:hypothetical protein C8R42DRAFT_304154 [Lentinula raphanica]
MHLNVNALLYLVLGTLSLVSFASPLPQSPSQEQSPSTAVDNSERTPLPSFHRLFSFDSSKSSKSDESKSKSKTPKLTVKAGSVDLLGEEWTSADITKPAKETLLELLHFAAVRQKWHSNDPFYVEEWINHPALGKDGYMHFQGELIFTSNDPEDTQTRGLMFFGRLRGSDTRLFLSFVKKSLDGEIYVQVEREQRLLVRVINSKIVKDISRKLPKVDTAPSSQTERSTSRDG